MILVSGILFALMFHVSSAETLNAHELVQGSLRYLVSEQKQETEGDDHYQGEWPSFIYNDEPIYLLGEKGKTAYDSNCFTTASIRNTLAALYLKHSEYSEILPMLRLSKDYVERYRDEGTDQYGFWQRYPSEKNPEIRVRRPNHYRLDSNFIREAANVPADADDTSVAFVGRFFDQKLGIGTDAPDDVGTVFAPHRDRHRWNIHYYNFIYGLHLKTGAFLTWLYHEKVLNPLAPLPHKSKPNIPYGANEVDCVVNANVLTALAYGHALDTPGVTRACRFINRAIRRKEFDRCGVYYPNRYHLHYAVAKAIEAGASCLNESEDGLIRDLISTQNADGGWSSTKPHDLFQKLGDGLNLILIKSIEKDRLSTRSLKNLEGIDPRDRVQATLYATNALLRLRRNQETTKAIDRGIRFLSQNALFENGTIHWKGGVFFSGGTLIRSAMRWRSDSYSTAIGAETFQMFIDQSGGTQP